MGGRHGGRSRVSGKEGLTAVRKRLQSYADRGVFRGLAEEPLGRSRYRFKFLWLTPAPFTLVYVPKSGSIVIQDLLPNVGPRTAVRKEIRAFILSRTDSALPKHRRIDARAATVTCEVRGGLLSVKLVAKRRDHDYAVNRAVNLIHEIFVQLHTYFPEYMWENFDVPEE